MTPARMAQAAIQVACVLNSPNLQSWAGVLRASMVCAPGYDRPVGSRLQAAAERQGLPALPRAPELLVAESQHILPHVAAAVGLDSPLADLALQASGPLRSVKRWEGICRHRKDKLDKSV